MVAEYLITLGGWFLGGVNAEGVSRVVLAYSGGLDTSVCIRWLIENYRAEVVTVTVDVGQEDDFGEIERRAYAIGAVRHYTIDAKEEFALNYVFPAIRANALYEGKYPLGTALARPLIALKVLEVARREGADAVAHGSTSKGNDQVRFDLTIMANAEGIRLLTPVRVWGMTRSDELEYARKHGIPIPEVHKRFSIDDNLWSRSIEGPELDDPYVEPPEDAFKWTIDPRRAPDRVEYLEIEFREGVPVKVNGERMDPVGLIQFLNRFVGSTGFGRIDHVENRVVGFKSREIYEAPAALTLINAHVDLEKLIYTPRELRFKSLADEAWSDLVYQGLWIEPLRAELESFIGELNRYVEGLVRLRLYKGSMQIVGRESPYAGYSRDYADYLRGWYPSDAEARGFITMWGLHSITAYRRRMRKQ